MVSIHRIKCDVENNQWFIPTDLGVWENGILDFDCVSKMHDWTPIEFYIKNPKHKRGDFTYVGAGILAFNEKIKLDIDVYEILEMSGEILPIKLEDGENAFLLNIMSCQNVLDKAKTQFRKAPSSGRITGIVKYAFHSERFCESRIFKIPDTSLVEILVRDDGTDNLNFRQLVLERGYTGLIFEELWLG